jgi:hypothetical protein
MSPVMCNLAYNVEWLMHISFVKPFGGVVWSLDYVITSCRPSHINHLHTPRENSCLDAKFCTSLYSK